MRVYLRASFLVVVLVASTLVHAEGPRRLGPAERVLQEFDVFKDGDLLLVPVTLKGKEFLFALDTGSTLTVYDSSLKPLLGLPKGSGKGTTPDGDVTLPLYDPPPAALGRLAVRSST